MIKFFRIILVVLVIECMLPICVFADNTGTVTITNTTRYSTGIMNFVVTYITDTQMNLSWEYDPDYDISKVMIRAKYGSYPNAIPDQFTAPTDGYLVYYGNGITTSDTSMNFDENPGSLFYTAWAQNSDGTWQIRTMNDNKESQEMVLLSFIGLIIGLIVANVMSRNSFIPIKMISAFFWVVPLLWVKSYPPSFIANGSDIQVAFIVLIIGAFLICFIGAFRQPLQMSKTTNWKSGYNTISTERGGFHLPDWLQDKSSYQYKAQERNTRISAYKERVHNATMGARKVGRDGRFAD